MAIGMTNLFTRLGKILGCVRNVRGFCSLFEPSPSSVWSGGSGPNIHCLNTMLTNVQGQLQSSYPELLAGGVYGVSGALYALQTSLPSSLQGAQSYWQSLAKGFIMDVVNQDVALPSVTIESATKEMIRQMLEQGSTFKANGVNSSVQAGAGNTGNPTVVIITKDAHGRTLEYQYNEAMALTCTRDRFNGATAGNETINISAPQGSVAPSLDPRWPSGSGFGSGYSGQMTIVDPTQNNGAGGNLLANSAWKGTWTSNLPQYWLADVGTAGTNWQQSTATYYAGTAQAFQFIGDGATLASVYQNFANGSVTTGNTSTLSSGHTYIINCYLKLSAASPRGVIAFSLTDDSGTVLNDDAGNPCTVSQDLSYVANTNWNALSGALRTPTVMPTKCRLRMKLTTPLDSGKNLFVDYLALTDPTQQTYGGLYTGGPYMAAFRGSTDCIDNLTNPAVGDRWTANVNNDYSGIFQTLLWQLLNIPSIGIPFPSTTNGSPSIADTLVS